MELTQEQAIQLVDNIGLTLGLERHTDTMGCSYYAISNDTVVRISDHSTYLQTWVDNGTSSKPNLFSIVIEVNPSKPNPNINSDTLFKVIEYKHRLRSLLNGEEYLELINAIKGAIGNGGQFSNPFGVKKKLLCSKYSPKTDGENEQPIKESKTRKDMKQNRIKLTESRLKQMIAESVRNVLKENGRI